MAHNLEMISGVASFVENGRRERAWHGLGKVFDRPLTITEALEGSRADYTVGLQPLVMLTPEMERILSEGGTLDADIILDNLLPDRKATMRTDTGAYLGNVNPSYGIVQNADAFRFIDALVTGQVGGSSNQPVIETAGVLGHGERVFVTAKFPEKIVLDAKRDDLVEMYMVFTTAHDGSGAVRCMVTPVRVVCNNTLNMAIQHNTGCIFFKHSKNVMTRLDVSVKENLEMAYKSLNLFETYSQALQESFDRLRHIQIGEKMLEKVLAQTFLSDKSLDVYRQTGDLQHEDIATRGKNLIGEVREAIESRVGQELVERGTGLWVINGLTTFFQNSANFRSMEYKFDSIMDGAAKQKVQKAFDLVCEAA